MLGGKNRQPLGYTIIEVMIVLAVSGVMFLIAATFINGKQQHTAFTAGVNEMASQLQDLINQVQSGKYSDVLLSCQQGSPVSVTFGTNQQGANPDCVFLGKMIHFWPHTTLSGQAGTAHDFETLSIAGNRIDTTGSPVTDPTAPNSGTAVVSQLTTPGVIPQQLDIYPNGASHGVNVDGTPAFAFGFLQSQGSTDPSTGSATLVTGAQNIQIYYVPLSQGSTVSMTNLTTGKSADICLTDGTRYAEIKIGGNQSQLQTTVKMDGATAC